MTLHVRPHFFARLVMCAAILLLQWPARALAQPVVSPLPPRPTPTSTSTLAERLDRLSAEIERNRIDLHVPGVALAIVRGDEVVFARGFGLADVAKKTPVTPSTQFFIGSSTKAFTATLVGMLVDEGKMSWDDPVEKYLPEFKLAVQSKDPNDRATLRDVLSHRTGFTRMVLLDVNNGMSSEEILRRASSAEPVVPFRQRFLYNNEHYVAAGSAAAAAAGAPWGTLVEARILAPLGMTSTRTTRKVWNDPGMTRGYRWDEARNKLEPVPLETQGVNVDGRAPAGAISSTALDMTAWIRFLLRQGVNDGKALISPASLAATWTPQIQIGDNAAYGMGWFVRNWQGQRYIEHGGAIPGFSAEVGLLPDSNLGFVVLTNSKSSLPSIARELVPRYLLSELPPVPKERLDLKPYLGRYVAHFANDVFTISERNGRLVIDMPSQMESALEPSRADGRWPLVMTDQLAVSFDRDEKGRVVGLKLHKAGSALEAPREGVVIAPEIPLAQLQKYLGRYVDAGGAREFNVVIQNQRLAVRLPNDASLDLRPPDAAGRRVARANAELAFTFEESPTGAVTAMSFHRAGTQPAMRLTPISEALPTVAEIMALRRIAAANVNETVRSTGRIRFAQSGVDGRFVSETAGDERLRTDIDLDGIGQIQLVLNQGRGWRAAPGDSLKELAGKELRQTLLGSHAVLFGDWRQHFDAVRVLRAGKRDSRKIYVVQLESAGLPPTKVSVDAETGDVLEVERMLISDGSAMPVQSTYADYREVGGRRVPYRFVEKTEASGRTISEVESIEFGVKLTPGVFAPTRVKSRAERQQ